MTDKALFSLDNAPIGSALAAWHAEPVAAEVAAHWLHERPPGARHTLAGLLARHWCGQDIALEWRDLRRSAQAPEERALVDLVRGQLGIAHRLRGAMADLDRGFLAAGPLLAPRDYLAVLKRHNTLRWLVLGDLPAPALGLDALLRQAEVTRRLRASTGEDPRFAPGASRRPPDDDPEHREDTVG